MLFTRQKQHPEILSGHSKIIISEKQLPFYRPYSFASQPFDCFAKDIQFSRTFLFRGYVTILPQRCQALPENVFRFFQVLSAPRQHLFLFLYSSGHRAAVPCRVCPCKRHSYPNFSGAIAFKKIKSARFSDDFFRFVKGFHLYFCFFETFSRVFYCKSVSKAL